MPVHDDLGTRMKEYYEQVSKIRLVRRMPVAIRIDGKAFHTFTKWFKKPFDSILMKSMQQTMKYLCENIQGCVLGYTQSDEITLILVDYKELNSGAFFDYDGQKLCSITASMATMAFNKFFNDNVLNELDVYRTSLIPQDVDSQKEMFKYHESLIIAKNRGAMFDSRCFNIPKEEVTNLIYWRQLDAIRNSIQMVGQANFSHNELQNKTCNMIQDMLYEQKGINWNDYPTECKRGTCCIKQSEKDEKYVSYDGKSDLVHLSSTWIIDKEIPIFKGDGRSYIEQLIYIDEKDY